MKKKARRQLLARLKAMTPKEGFTTLVDAGIYTKGGRLRANYRAGKRKIV